MRNQGGKKGHRAVCNMLMNSVSDEVQAKCTFTGGTKTDKNMPEELKKAQEEKLAFSGLHLWRIMSGN